MPVGDIIGEGLVVHNIGSHEDRDNAVREIMTTIKPLIEYVSAERGSAARGARISASALAWAVVAMTLVSAAIGLLIKFG